LAGLRKVTEPDAGLFGELFDVGAAIASEGERDPEVAALAVRPAVNLPGRFQVACDDQLASIALSLGDAVGNVDALAFGFNDGNRGEACEQHVVSVFFRLARRPLGNGFVLTFLRARSLAIGKIERVGFPSSIVQLLVDEDAGEVFVEVELTAGLLSLAGNLLGGLRLVLQLFVKSVQARFKLSTGPFQSCLVL